MTKIISVHEYELKSDVDPRAFEQAILDAEKRGLLDLAGLTEYHLLKGIKGSRAGSYAAIWVYQDRQAWERLWDSPDKPKGKSSYPENWRIWEEEILAPFLDRDPDKIVFTSYEEWQT